MKINWSVFVPRILIPTILILWVAIGCYWIAAFHSEYKDIVEQNALWLPKRLCYVHSTTVKQHPETRYWRPEITIRNYTPAFPSNHPGGKPPNPGYPLVALIYAPDTPYPPAPYKTRCTSPYNCDQRETYLYSLGQAVNFTRNYKPGSHAPCYANFQSPWIVQLTYESQDVIAPLLGMVAASLVLVAALCLLIWYTYTAVGKIRKNAHRHRRIVELQMRLGRRRTSSARRRNNTASNSNEADDPQRSTTAAQSRVDAVIQRNRYEDYEPETDSTSPSTRTGNIIQGGAHYNALATVRRPAASLRRMEVNGRIQRPVLRRNEVYMLCEFHREFSNELADEVIDDVENQNADRDLCVICLDLVHTYDQNDRENWTVRLPCCKNRFHRLCIETWFLRGAASCPLCAYDYFSTGGVVHLGGRNGSVVPNNNYEAQDAIATVIASVESDEEQLFDMYNDLFLNDEDDYREELGLDAQDDFGYLHLLTQGAHNMEPGPV